MNKQRPNIIDKINLLLENPMFNRFLFVWFCMSIIGLILISIRNSKENENAINIYALEDQINKLRKDILTDQTKWEEILKQQEIVRESENRVKIIEMVKNTLDTENNKTFGEITQKEIETGAKSDTIYKWNVEQQPYGTYLVSFVDVKDERGTFWEVDLSTYIVREINGNFLLEEKYDITPLRYDNLFLVKVENENIETDNGIYYKLKASLTNKSGEDITDCAVGVKIEVMYSPDKVVEASTRIFDFEDTPSESNPWLPNQTRKVTVYTKPYDEMFSNYSPGLAVCYLYIAANNPLGFEYSGAISKRNIKDLFPANGEKDWD